MIIRSRLNRLLVIATLALFPLASMAQSSTCNGKFPNPITDYCWKATMPIKVAKAAVANVDKQEDNDSSSSVNAVCTCGSGIDTKLGVSMSFWEPIIMVDVVRKPFCLAGLGGIEMDKVMDAPQMGMLMSDEDESVKTTFYNVHQYANPILYWMGALSNSTCLDRSPFDLLEISEVMLPWNDEELSSIIINPDAFLYANPISQLACVGDCVTASAGFAESLLYWCAGCQGSMFPLTGTVYNEVSKTEAASLVLQRALNMAHRSLMAWGTSATPGGSAENGTCYKYPKYMMDKADYKYSMVFPYPEKKDASGRCANPLGRTTTLWSIGHTFPFYGEDSVWMLFRKRDCCEGAGLANGTG